MSVDATSPPCPACGQAMIQGVCPDSKCESNLAQQGGGWQPTDIEENITKTYADWLAEFGIEAPDPIPADFMEEDGLFDKDRRYTKADFLRRMSQ